MILIDYGVTYKVLVDLSLVFKLEKESESSDGFLLTALCTYDVISVNACIDLQ